MAHHAKEAAEKIRESFSRVKESFEGVNKTLERGFEFLGITGVLSAVGGPARSRNSLNSCSKCGCNVRKLRVAGLTN